jgi:hypothetical protein
MHEPLLLGLTLHFASCPAWQHRNSPPLLALERSLHTVWQDDQGDERAILHKLCALPAELETM